MSEASGVWLRATVSVDDTIEAVVRSLNDTALQIALIVSGDRVLEGTVTDGDVRRGLLRGLSLSSPVSAIMNPEAFVVPGGLPREAALDLMLANNVRHLPVVDAQRRIIGLHLWQDVSTTPSLENTVVLMAGGLGTRLRPLTDECPKPLLRVSGRPMLEHIIRRAKLEGFRRFCVAVHYLGHMIEDYFGDGSKLGVGITYLREETPLGTAGALSLLPGGLRSPVVVMNGDVISDVRLSDLVDFHGMHRSTATMAVRSHEWQHPFGVVRTSGIDIIDVEEKPVVRTHINAGVYVLEPSAIASLVPGERCDMPTLFLRLRAAGERTIAYPMHEPWLDVGRPADFDRAQTLTTSDHADHD
ncbi:MAG: nucleotidyltransferase family protein [Gemmatimonadota bacterium]